MPTQVHVRDSKADARTRRSTAGCWKGHIYLMLGHVFPAVRDKILFTINLLPIATDYTSKISAAAAALHLTIQPSLRRPTDSWKQIHSIDWPNTSPTSSYSIRLRFLVYFVIHESRSTVRYRFQPQYYNLKSSKKHSVNTSCTPSSNSSTIMPAPGTLDSSTSRPPGWTSAHDDFVRSLAKNGEDARTVTILLETEFPALLGKVDMAWVKGRMES